MPSIEIADLGTVGLIRDQEGNVLPPEAWTLASNMRATADGVERIGGQRQVFGTPGVAPHFALPISSPAQTYWLYVSLTKAHVFDGTTHTDITRVLGDYGASNTRDWNGTLLGGVPILNNGVDDPQYWGALNPATKLAALPNWPANTKAKVLRAFGPYLIALHPTESGTVYPHVARWSHPADPGTVPSSWDYSDATKDAGRNELPDVHAGVIIEGLPLRGHFYIYKEASTWRMSLIGGSFIFDFDAFLETSGILAPRCVTITADGTRHVVATQDDIVVHNGNSAESILTARYKRYLFNSLDTENYVNSFIFTNPFRDEVVFCYPESGTTYPNRALIWSYRRGARGVLTEADVNYRNAAVGVIETASDELWSDNPTVPWSTDDGPWSQVTRRKVVVCGTSQSKFFEFDTGATNDGEGFEGVLQRENIALVGRKRNGEWIVDFEKRKLLRRLWIRATGGPINIRVGFQEQMSGAISWSSEQVFDPTTQHFVDVFGSGRAVSVEFKAAVPFKVLSYKLEGDLIGDMI